MKEIKLGGTEFTASTATKLGYYIIGSFGGEGTGKTRFPITGPEVIGFVPLERKSYATIEKDAAELGKVVWKPKDPERLIVNPRKANLLSVPSAPTDKAKDEANAKVREYYRDFANRSYDAIYAMLEHPDIRTVVVDTFTTFCDLEYHANYGFENKIIKIEGKHYQDRKDYNNALINFMNSLSNYQKHVILLHRYKDEYNKSGPTGRKVWEGWKFLGNYTSLLIHHESNPRWDPDNDDENRQWHFALSIRTCQNASHLEGPEGYRCLKDSSINFPSLIMLIDPNVDADTLC